MTSFLAGSSLCNEDALFCFLDAITQKLLVKVKEVKAIVNNRSNKCIHKQVNLKKEFISLSIFNGLVHQAPATLEMVTKPCKVIQRF